MQLLLLVPGVAASAWAPAPASRVRACACLSRVRACAPRDPVRPSCVPTLARPLQVTLFRVHKHFITPEALFYRPKYKLGDNSAYLMLYANGKAAVRVDAPGVRHAGAPRLAGWLAPAGRRREARRAGGSRRGLARRAGGSRRGLSSAGRRPPRACRGRLPGGSQGSAPRPRTTPLRPRCSSLLSSSPSSSPPTPSCRPPLLHRRSQPAVADLGQPQGGVVQPGL